MPSKISFLLLLSLLLPLIFCDIEEPSLDLDLDDMASFEEDAVLMKILDKYDENHQGFYTKENYRDLLIDILMIASGDNDGISDAEQAILKRVVGDYVEKQGKKTFTYQEVLQALENTEVLEALSAGLENAGDVFKTQFEAEMQHQEKNEKLKKKALKKNKNQEKPKKSKKTKKSKKAKKSKKNVKKQENDEGCGGEAIEDPNGQCPMPANTENKETENLEQTIIELEETTKDQETFNQEKKQEEL